MNNPYVHGYSAKEASRLNDQANTLDELLHHDSLWEENSLILEAGCGVGAQTKIIAPKNLTSSFISIDISSDSLVEAEHVMQELGIENVEFMQADIFNLPYSNAKFDHVFVSFVLEHLVQPEVALLELKRVLKPGGSIMIIEGDHGSTYFYPESKLAQKAILCQVTLQRLKGGNANIGRSLYPLLLNGGFTKVEVSPRMVYVDDSKPALVDGFTRKTFTAMIEGIADEAIEQGLISANDMNLGIEDLYRTAAGEGTFCYTFFKGKGIKRKN